MAVKVMVAPAIANAAAERRAAGGRDGAAAKPRKRRASVYDADGNEVFITLMCLKCHKMRPLSQFGLRRMADGAIRNQPWCRSCRSGTAERPRAKRGRPAEGEPSPREISAAGAAVAAPPSAGQRPSSSVAAEVAAALAAGMRR